MARGFLDEDDARDAGGEGEIARDDRKTIELSGFFGATARGGYFFHTGERDVFVPFSIEKDRSRGGAMMQTITVPEWWAKKEGLI